MVTLFFAALFVNDGDQARAIHRDGGATATFYVLEVHELDDTVVARFERGTLGNAGGGSADVERTHRELRAGFADRLRGDDADRFAEFDHAARGEVAAVASAQTPRRDSQVSTERMRTRSIPAPCTEFASSSVISWFTSTMTWPSKSLILSSETRPTIRSRSGSTSTPASMMGSTKMPSLVPQSRSLMITSCATSTRRRVR